MGGGRGITLTLTNQNSVRGLSDLHIRLEAICAKKDPFKRFESLNSVIHQKNIQAKMGEVVKLCIIKSGPCECFVIKFVWNSPVKTVKQSLIIRTTHIITNYLIIVVMVYFSYVCLKNHSVTLT